MTDEERKNAEIVLCMWRARLARAADAHYRASDNYSSRDKFFTILNILSAILVLFFANSDEAVDLVVKMFVGEDSKIDSSKILISFAGLFTVLTSAYQYVKNFKELSWVHKQAASEFSNLKRKIERILTTAPLDGLVVHTINRDYRNVAMAYPAVPRKVWHDRKNASAVLIRDDDVARDQFERFLTERFGVSD
jgi:hypothetical protein